MYAFLVLFHMTLFRWFKNGPLMSWFIPKFVQVCNYSWWKNMLYITNFQLANDEATDITVSSRFDLIFKIIPRLRAELCDQG